jgi:acylpyruvate hydrolase
LRIVSFLAEGVPRLGALRGESVVDIARCVPGCPSDLLSLLQKGPEELAALDSAVKSAPPSALLDLASLRICLPLANPRTIVCLGLNYADHAAEGGHSRPSYPSLFLRSNSSLVAHCDPILRPGCSEKLDFEAELVAVIGRKARHVHASEALQYIAGYSCFNDATIRDYQRRTSQWTIGKNFDSTGAFGPAFVTSDELPPGAQGLHIRSRLNGQVMQDANTRDMLFPVAETVAILTECMTLNPGDLVVMGTPAGVGHARKPPVWMKHGDVVEIEIEQVGLLRNPVRDESATAT